MKSSVFLVAAMVPIITSGVDSAQSPAAPRNVRIPSADARAHAYFDKWAADPRIVIARSMRNDADLLSMAQGWSSRVTTAAPGWVYDAATDAAKGTVFQTYPDDADLLPQLVMFNPASAGTVTFVWDVLIPAEWTNEPQEFVAPLDGPISPGRLRTGSGVPGKAFQTTQMTERSGLGLHIETRLWSIKNQLPSIAWVDWRNYTPLGPGASNYASPRPYNDSDTVQPRLTPYIVMADTWTRFIEHVQLGAATSNGVLYDLWSLWVADERRDTVQIYDRIPVEHRTIKGFAFEYDSSQQRAPGSPPKSVYNRDFLMLNGMVDPTMLFERPVR
jgi:hypothetical protein